MSLNSILASSLRWSSSATTVAEADALLAKLWASSEARRFLVSDSPADATTAEPIAVRTGVMSVNTNTSVRTELPFGGFKRSGMGRELGWAAMDHYTESKTLFLSSE